MSLAAALLGAPLWLATAAAPSPTPGETAQRIRVEVHGPVALVEVTRSIAADGPADGERLLDLALPEGAALLDVAFVEGGRWRLAAAAPRPGSVEGYVARLETRGVVPTRAPLEDGTTERIRVAGGGRAPVGLRYRFVVMPATAAGRRSLRFPASPERTPVAADVTAVIPGAVDVEIAGARAVGAPARGHASTRGAWQISWATRAPPTGAAVSLSGEAALGPLDGGKRLAAVSVEARGRRALEPPPSALFLVDRSRSVGLPGLAAERDLLGRLLEALPPATRFDALFFERDVRRLFPMSRPATREAMSAFEAEMVPDRLQNGTDLRGALGEAGALLRREAAAFGLRALVVLVTDGALPEGVDGAALTGALGATPGVDVTLAVFVIRPPGDDPAPPAALRALRELAAAHAGVVRALAANELEGALDPALAALARGGDVAEVRLVAGDGAHALADHLAPGEGQARLLTLADTTGAAVWAAGGEGRVRARLAARPVDAAWLRALAARPFDTHVLTTDGLVALIEPGPGVAPAATDAVRGSLDRVVVRNVLSLAYMPRARACYLNRTAATPALRDLTGRVRLAIDLTRGEVGDVVVQSSTLHQPDIEACLREGAFAIDVPRALRSDAPSTAILNLVFRPRTPEKPETAEEAALGERIDLVIEELERAAPRAVDEPPAVDRSMIPTR